MVAVLAAALFSTIALLGTNGAGKSTVLRAISGLSSPQMGSVSFEGTDISGMPAHRVAAQGIIQVPGGKAVFPSLTVAENLRLATWALDDATQITTATDEALAYFPRLRERLGEAAGNLSGGEQQMLVLGQALLGSPQLLMIDELTLGLAPVVVGQLLETVRRLADDGVTIVLVEQSVNVALTLATRAVSASIAALLFCGAATFDSTLARRAASASTVALSTCGGGGAILPGDPMVQTTSAAAAAPKIAETTAEDRIVPKGDERSRQGVRAASAVSACCVWSEISMASRSSVGAARFGRSTCGPVSSDLSSTILKVPYPVSCLLYP